MRTLSPLVALALLSACSGPGRSLQAFDDCDAMSSYMKRMAVKELRWNGRLNFTIGGRAEFDLAAVEDSGGIATPTAPDYSTTNLQEAGVDEADLVKTDGTNLYTLAGRNLIVTKAWPVDEAAVLGQVEIDGRSRGLYLLEDGVTAVVISDLDWGQSPQPVSGAEAGWRSNTPSSVVTVVDLTDPAAPTLVRETYVTGSMRTTRRIGDQLFVVTYEDIDLDTWDVSTREARARVYASQAPDWQARRFDNRLFTRGPDVEPEWESDTGPVCDCEETFYSESLGGTFVSSALVLDLSDPLSDFQGTAVAGRADTVYMSPESLYVAYNEVQNGPFTSFDDVLETVVHKFDVSGEAPAYAASGVVRGVLDDLFSLSEKDGVLRMAVTDWGRNNQESDVSSGVYTLEEQDGELAPLDWVIGLAEGEAITSARFVGDFGYITTYAVQFGDPLFTFDMSDPHHIVQGGELAVTGWSDYLHPMGDGRLIAVGMEDYGEGWGQDLAVSLYDVSDLQNPSMVEREILDSWGSEAQSDHHAFNYFATTESLTIPSWAQEGDTVLEVLHVDADSIEQVGRVHQSETMLPNDYWCGGVRRSVVIGDYVWAVSNAGMTAARLDDPEGEQVAVPFTGIDPCADQYYYGEDW